MSLDFISQSYISIVLAACLAVGYVIKKSLDFIPNKYIPLILAVLGAVLGCITEETVSMESIVYGVITGLASTSIHQTFTRMMEGVDTGASKRIKRKMEAVRMGSYNISAGHNPPGKVACGACGLLRDESRENRLITKEVIRLLKSYGQKVYDCTCNNGKSQSDVLKKIVEKCNKKKA